MAYMSYFCTTDTEPAELIQILFTVLYPGADPGGLERVASHPPSLFPGSAKLFFTCSMEKRSRPGIIYHVSGVEGREGEED